MDSFEVAEKCSCRNDEKSSEETRPAAPRRAYVPGVDVVDGAGETVVFADMPGVDEASISIMLENNILSIKGTPEDIDYPGKSLVYREFGVGDYERSFSLTDTVDRDAISASIKDGVLRVVLPKSNHAARKIEVAAS